MFFLNRIHDSIEKALRTANQRRVTANSQAENRLLSEKY